MDPAHFEVYPELSESDRAALTEAQDAEARQLAPIGHAAQVRDGMGIHRWRWRFVRDRDGQELAASSIERGWSTPSEATHAVALFVGQIRVATYGQRFDAEIADAVLIVEQ